MAESGGWLANVMLVGSVAGIQGRGQGPNALGRQPPAAHGRGSGLGIGFVILKVQSSSVPLPRPGAAAQGRGCSGEDFGRTWGTWV